MVIFLTEKTVNDKESNLNNNANMNTSAMNDKWGDKSAGTVLQKNKSNSISE